MPDRSVHMHLVSGPFRTLEGDWRLTPIEAHGCRVEFAVRFEFSNRLPGCCLSRCSPQTIGSLVDAFVQRARAPA